MNPWVRFFAKSLLWLLGLLAAILVIIGGLSWWVISYPEKAWRVAERHLLPSDLRVTWKEIRFQPRKINWRHWDIDWEIKGLDIRKNSPMLAAPIDDVRLVFSFRLFDPDTRADFDTIVVRAEQSIRFQPSEGLKAENNPPTDLQRLRAWIGELRLADRYASMRALEVDVKDFILLSAGGPTGAPPVHLALNLRKPADAAGGGAAAAEAGLADEIAWRVEATSEVFKAQAKGRLNASSLLGAETPFLTAEGGFNGFGAAYTGSLEATYQGDVLGAVLKGAVESKLKNAKVPSRFEHELSVTWTDARGGGRLEAKLGGSVSRLPGPLARVDGIEGRITVPLSEGSGWGAEPSTFALSAPVGLFFVDASMRPALEVSCQCQLPRQLKVSAEGRLWAKPLLQEKTGHRQPVADFRVSIESLKNRLFSAQLAATMKIFKDGATVEYEPRLDSEIHVNTFRGLRQYLDAKNVMIPAPFNVLDGVIDLTARGAINRDGGRNATPITMKVALGSAKQRVDVQSEITLNLDKTLKGMDVYIRLLIDNFQVELPPLDPIQGLPKVARDSRIQLQPPPGKAAGVGARGGPAFKMRLFFEAKTTRPGAIRLLSKYAHPDIPVSLNVQRAMDGNLTGSVQMEQFDILYLRRTVHVDQLRLLLDAQDGGDFPVDGRFHVDQTQYRIFVDVSGSLRSPFVHLSSEPYLPRSEIISVLLYDRTSDQLVAADAETAGSFEAAMADRAIGLFGLWAFASTPIRSFSYNPVTKVYSATVQLAGGVTAGIGTNWEEAAHFEVRKRVSKRWVLTASWSPSETDRSQVGKLILQWEKRF